MPAAGRWRWPGSWWGRKAKGQQGNTVTAMASTPTLLPPLTPAPPPPPSPAVRVRCHWRAPARGRGRPWRFQPAPRPGAAIHAVASGRLLISTDGDITPSCDQQHPGDEPEDTDAGCPGMAKSKITTTSKES